MSSDWFWEGNIQQVVIDHLRREGWRITFAADTASRQHGVDIEAEKDGRKLAVEVKGWPSKFYARGEPGRLKRTNPPTQARHWYAEVLRKCIFLRSSRPDWGIVLAFADYPTYRRLIGGTEISLRLLKLGVYLVDGKGEVETLISPEEHTAA